MASRSQPPHGPCHLIAACVQFQRSTNVEPRGTIRCCNLNWAAGTSQAHGSRVNTCKGRGSLRFNLIRNKTAAINLHVIQVHRHITVFGSEWITPYVEWEVVCYEIAS